MAKHAKHAKPEKTTARYQAADAPRRGEPAQRRASHAANSNDGRTTSRRRAESDARPDERWATQPNPRLQVPAVAQGAETAPGARRARSASHTAPVDVPRASRTAPVDARGASRQVPAKTRRASRTAPVEVPRATPAAPADAPRASRQAPSGTGRASHTEPVNTQAFIYTDPWEQQSELGFHDFPIEDDPFLSLEQQQQHAAWAQAPEIRPVPSRRLPGCVVPLIITLLLLIIAVAAIVVIRPSFAEPFIERIQGQNAQSEAANQDAAAESQTQAATPSSNANVSGMTEVPVRDSEVTEQAKEAERNNVAHKCRLLAQCKGVDIYSPIPQDQITGVIMHQASYEWAQTMTTELPEADLEEFQAGGKPLRVNNEQSEGTWADADAAHLWREGDTTEMDTAIDVGADAGTTVYSPVTGTVIAVTDYDLYEETPDVRIHIRPDSNPDLDVVLLHQSDPTIEAGDHVVAGITPIAKTRDIGSVLTDVQLAFYTNTTGNHSHVQVNDLTNEDYLEKYDLKVN